GSRGREPRPSRLPARGCGRHIRPNASVLAIATVLPPRAMRTSPPDSGVPFALSATVPPISPFAPGPRHIGVAPAEPVRGPAAASHTTTGTALEKLIAVICPPGRA